MKIGDGLISRLNYLVSEVMENGGRVALVSDETVFSHYGETVVGGLALQFPPVVHLIGKGENEKTLASVEKLLTHWQKEQIKREDVVLAVGGGIVGDVAGFAASIYRRGIRCIQIPTTLLAMIDSSVGGKTGVNLAPSKNSIGTFHDPSLVIVDPKVLMTLDQRQFNAGLYEAIKHGILGGDLLFDRTLDLVDSFCAGDPIGEFLAEQIAFKASIVTGDPHESTSGSSSMSRKVLNLGHTFGHALESATYFARLLHGEAVGYGLMIAATLSESLALLSKTELNLVCDVVHRTGLLPSVVDVSADDVVERMSFDKKSSSGEIELILLNGIGKPCIVTLSQIPRQAVISAIGRILNGTV